MSRTNRIDSGRRDCRLTIQKTVQSRTDTGDVTDSWVTHKIVHADLRQLKGAEQQYATQIVEGVTHVAVFPYTSGVTTKMRMTDGTTKYYISWLDNERAANVQYTAYLKQAI